jgi:hypothetical protein
VSISRTTAGLPSSPGISLRERERERELARSDGFLAASREFSPRFLADMSRTAQKGQAVLERTEANSVMSLDKQTLGVVYIYS